MTAIDPQRVSFLSRLSESAPQFVVLKHLDDFLRGNGDIDAAAPLVGLEDLTRQAATLAGDELAATHMIVCDHVPNVRFHYFVQSRTFPELVELDIWMQPSRGSAQWASADLLADLAEVDLNGIRRLRPGAEAVFHIVYKGIRWSGGHPIDGRDGRSVDDGLANDREGAMKACRLLPPRTVTRPLTGLVDAVGAGSWSRWHARAAFLGFALAGAAAPVFAVRQAVHRVRYTAGRECTMFALMRRHGREVPDGDLGALLSSARGDGHQIVVLTPSGETTFARGERRHDA